MNDTCHNCGRKVAALGDFCGNCGAKKVQVKEASGSTKSQLDPPKTDGDAIAKSKSAPDPISRSKAGDESFSISPEQTETAEIISVPLYRKLLAPIIFDRSTIKIIGNEQNGTSKALLLFIINLFFMATSPIFSFNSRGFNRIDREEFTVIFLFLSLFLLFLILSLQTIAWSYAAVLKWAGAYHKTSEIFRLACYSSNWIAIGTLISHLRPDDYELHLFLLGFFPYVYLFGFILSVSIYTEVNFFVVALLGVIVAIITWIVGFIIGAMLLIILFILVFS